jgi:hypothetical protein
MVNTIKKNTEMNVKPSYNIVHQNLNHFQTNYNLTAIIKLNL